MIYLVSLRACLTLDLSWVLSPKCHFKIKKKKCGKSWVPENPTEEAPLVTVFSSLSLSLSFLTENSFFSDQIQPKSAAREISSSSSTRWPCLRTRRSKAPIRPHRRRYDLPQSSSVLPLSSSCSIVFLYCHQTLELKP